MAVSRETPTKHSENCAQLICLGRRIASGEVEVKLGGPAGRTLTFGPGDVIIIPAGVAHRNVGQSGPLQVVGAYPGAADYDTRRGDRAEYQDSKKAAASVKYQVSDPVTGGDGALKRLWAAAMRAPEPGA